jgi:pSer/pThr/pTyr-binding forkhead associated (FHA) protein
VTETHIDHSSGEATANTAYALRPNLFEPNPPGAAHGHGVVFGIDELPSGSGLLVVKRGPNAGSRFVLDRLVTFAGRHPNSDIYCDDITVSRRHAEFHRQNSEFQVVDVGSLNGTYVNGEPVQSAVLTDGDEIQIGKFRLVTQRRHRGQGDSAGRVEGRPTARARM